MEMVDHFVGSVNRDPPQFPRRRLWKRVVEFEIPIAWCEAVEQACEQDRRLLELYCDVERVLLVVSVVVDPFIAAHAERLVTVSTHRFQDAFTLHQEHVADVAGVLEARPSPGDAMVSNISGSSKQSSCGATRLSDLLTGDAPLRVVVSPRKRRARFQQLGVHLQMSKAALDAPSHPTDATAAQLAAESAAP